MSTRNLEFFFAPQVIALIGASRRDHAVGSVLARNLLAAGFSGPILPVNPHESSVGGVLAYKSVDALPVAPELAVLATPASAVPGLIRELGDKGCKAAVVITAGFEAADKVDQANRAALMDAAREKKVRIIGPNCLGIVAPGAGINASFAHGKPPAGRIACVLQSGALAAAIIDWGIARNIGFSKLVSIGDALDVDFGDMLEFLATDDATDAILLYVEGVTHARKFMQAAAAAARRKPVIVLKAGKAPGTVHIAKSHSGAAAGSDQVYAAAFDRSGLVRVDSLEEMLATAELLAGNRRPAGERLAIVTNGGGAGLLAADALVARGGVLATLVPSTVDALDQVLPSMWSKGNPVDIIGDADGARYASALKIIERDPGVDAVLAIHCPTAVTSPADAARGVMSALADSAAHHDAKPTFACWLGESASREARSNLVDSGIATFTDPEAAVAAFLRVLQASRHPEEDLSTDADSHTDQATVNALLCAALERGEDWLDEVDAKAVLNAYGIPVVQSVKAADPDQAGAAAARFGGPVALKIRSPDLTHKSNLGGVVLGLAGAEATRSAAHDMLDRIRSAAPDARLHGFVVEAMESRKSGFELLAGISTDATLGPVIVFGEGGVDVAQIADTKIALPPLSRQQAAKLIHSTRISRRLHGGRTREPAALPAVERVLIGLSRLAIEHPEIAELDINPLLVDAEGVIALDARIRVRDPALGILAAADQPSPGGERHVRSADGADILLRALRAEDAPGLQHFIESLDPATIRGRFFEMIKRLPPALLDRMTHLDPDREMAVVAIDRTTNPDDDVICGVGRLIVLPDDRRAEYALTVSPAFLDKGIGRALLDRLIEEARARGLEQLCGEELFESTGLVELVRQAGASISQDHEDPAVACILLHVPPGPSA